MKPNSKYIRVAEFGNQFYKVLMLSNMVFTAASWIGTEKLN